MIVSDDIQAVPRHRRRPARAIGSQHSTGPAAQSHAGQPNIVLTAPRPANTTTRTTAAATAPHEPIETHLANTARTRLLARIPDTKLANRAARFVMDPRPRRSNGARIGPPAVGRMHSSVSIYMARHPQFLALFAASLCRCQGALRDHKSGRSEGVELWSPYYVLRRSRRQPDRDLE